jgi:hypothetical protein
LDLEKDLRELQEKLDSDSLSLAEREFRVDIRDAEGFHPSA